MAHMAAVFLLLLQLFLHVRAQENVPKIIPLGSSLSPSIQPSSWASSSGRFQFGFYTKGNGFAVGIWIVGRQENTVVWTASRDDPPLSPNATLELTRQGELLLRDEGGQKILIANHPGPYLTKNSVQYPVRNPYAESGDPYSRSGGSYSRSGGSGQRICACERNYSGNPADSASLLDSGNFVLYSDKSVIWESFDFPTDTILGGQNFTYNHALISSVSWSNHSTGKYHLNMQPDGNLVAYLNISAEADSSEAYWSPNVEFWDPSTSSRGPSFYGLSLDEEGGLLLYSFGRTRVLVLANGSGTGDRAILIYRATLDPDGIFRIYSHQFESNISSNGTKKWQNLDDPCDVKGDCGLNSYCSRRSGHVECYCYPGFTFIDELLGCSENFTIDACQQERKDQVLKYNITVFDNMIWTGVPYSLTTNSTDEDCKQACKQDCNCRGALYYSKGNCEMYTLPLKYGRVSENISTRAFIKEIFERTVIGPSPRQSSPSPNEGNQRLTSTMGISLGSVAGFCLLLAISSFFIYRHRVQNYRKLLENKSPGAELFTPQSFSFSELEKATDGFKEELGKGSFGAVYKGILPGDKAIAVKKLDKVNEREREFQTEMTVIGITNHRNLVRLLGFCVEGSRKFLVYEYLRNGSLSNFLFNTNRERPIWKDRARIALEVAKGILYLHEECEVCIIHCNIKPQNILLDDSMTAKISDFGLAKLWSPNDQTNITGLRRTARYSAPELQSNASLSVKVDVYSFGVILLEIICCRSSIEVKVSTADEILLSTWAYNCFVARELNKLVEGEEVDPKMLERFVKVGLWCIQDDPALRPVMKNVTLMLEGTMDVPFPPSPSPSVSHVSINCQ